MADASIQLAIEATNNARAALTQAASDLTALGGALDAAKKKSDALAGSAGALAGKLAAARKEAAALGVALRSLPGGGAVGAPVSGQAAGGGSFVTSGPALLLVGDNPGGRERVDVTPLSGRGQTRLHPDSGLIQAAGGATVTAGGARPIVVDMGPLAGLEEELVRRVADRFAAAGVPGFDVVLEL